MVGARSSERLVVEKEGVSDGAVEEAASEPFESVGAVLADFVVCPVDDNRRIVGVVGTRVFTCGGWLDSGCDFCF